MTDDEIKAKAAGPGGEGALARLLLTLPINNMDGWLNGEIIRGTDHYDISRALAEYCAAALFGLAARADDPEKVMNGTAVHEGLTGLLRKSLINKMDRHLRRVTPGGVFLPAGAIGLDDKPH
jgi:hypothetical protein